MTDDVAEEYLLSVGRIFHRISLCGSVIKVALFKPRTPYSGGDFGYRYWHCSSKFTRVLFPPTFRAQSALASIQSDRYILRNQSIEPSIHHSINQSVYQCHVPQISIYHSINQSINLSMPCPPDINFKFRIHLASAFQQRSSLTSNWNTSIGIRWTIT